MVVCGKNINMIYYCSEKQSDSTFIDDDAEGGPSNDAHSKLEKTRGERTSFT